MEKQFLSTIYFNAPDTRTLKHLSHSRYRREIENFKTVPLGKSLICGPKIHSLALFGFNRFYIYGYGFLESVIN